MRAERPFGVTAAICTHNGAGRIAAALEHLSRQRVPAEVRWETLVVDNASRDGTAALAAEVWQRLGAPAPLRVSAEPTLGLSFARERSLRDASFEIISLIDDDNLVCEDWISTCAGVMRTYPSAGAVGGRSRLPADARPPLWFSKLAYLYAIGDFGSEASDVTENRPLLWGAGLTLRASAWSNLYELGFRPMLSDRSGKSLISGGDSELCLALKRAGWRLRYEPRLQFEHVMPDARFEWSYFRRLARGSGRAAPSLDGFYAQYQSASPLRRSVQRWWLHQAIRTTLQGLRHGPAFVFPGTFLREGDPSAATLEALRGRLAQLLALRGAYGRRFVELDSCLWDASVAPIERVT